MALAGTLVAGLGLSPDAAAATYRGKTIAVGRGSAHTLVVTDATGHVSSVAIVFTERALDGLPMPAGDQMDVAFALPMPAHAPKTAFDHAVINWEPHGHPPPHIYDVPHFDFHFYMVSSAEQARVTFKSMMDSGAPAQQPPASLLPAGYVVPPGTAVPEMGVHAIDTSGPEFHGHPFTATFIYGFYEKQMTFLEPMASRAYLESKPNITRPVARPASYGRPGMYPDTYSIRYDKAHHSYTVALEGLR
jgi:hypothetical protein